MDAPSASPHRRLLVVCLITLAIAGCGAAADDPAPARPTRAVAATPSPDDVAGPTGSATGAPAPASATAEGLIAIAESLAPPDGTESGRNASDGAAGITWFTPRSLPELQAHYDRMASDVGLRTLLDSQTGTIQSWVFAGLPQGPVNASIQVTPAGDGRNRVMVTISPA